MPMFKLFRLTKLSSSVIISSLLIILFIAENRLNISDKLFYLLLGGLSAAIIREFIEFVESYSINKRVNKVCKDHLERIKKEIVKRRVEDKIIPFDWTIYNEISGGVFLFDFLIKYIEKIPLDKYPKTMEFFYHYIINMNTVKARLETTSSAFLTKETYDNLLNYLNNAISELS